MNGVTGFLRKQRTGRSAFHFTEHRLIERSSMFKSMPSESVKSFADHELVGLHKSYRSLSFSGQLELMQVTRQRICKSQDEASQCLSKNMDLLLELLEYMGRNHNYDAALSFYVVESLKSFQSGEWNAERAVQYLQALSIYRYLYDYSLQKKCLECLSAEVNIRSLTSNTQLRLLEIAQNVGLSSEFLELLCDIFRDRISQRLDFLSQGGDGGVINGSKKAMEKQPDSEDLSANLGRLCLRVAQTLQLANLDHEGLCSILQKWYVLKYEVTCVRKQSSEEKSPSQVTEINPLDVASELDFSEHIVIAQAVLSARIMHTFAVAFSRNISHHLRNIGGHALSSAVVCLEGCGALDEQYMRKYILPALNDCLSKFTCVDCIRMIGALGRSACLQSCIASAVLPLSRKIRSEVYDLKFCPQQAALEAIPGIRRLIGMGILDRGVEHRIRQATPALSDKRM